MGVGHIQTADEVKSHLGGYDIDIHYADYFVGKLIQDLKDSSRVARSIPSVMNTSFVR